MIGGLPVVAVAATCLAGGMLAGCGQSNDGPDRDEAIELRIARERSEAASLARQEQRVKDLREEVRRLKRAGAGTDRPADSFRDEPASAMSRGSSRTFHAPSGNVNCEVSESSARCSVISIGKSFVLSAGSTARMETGVAVAEYAGALADWGETVSVGQITCQIPLEDQPRGIICDDLSSDHGFEASRVPARQRTY